MQEQVFLIYHHDDVIGVYSSLHLAKRSLEITHCMIEWRWISDTVGVSGNERFEISAHDLLKVADHI